MSVGFDFHSNRISERIELLSKVSETNKWLTRTYGSDAFLEARNMVEGWMLEAGLETWVDNIGNIRGRLVASNSVDKTFCIGSHIDTVRNAGKFDGSLGVLTGIELAAYYSLQDGLPFNLEIIGFCDEEGVRFTTTYLGSSVLSNCFKEEWLDRKGEDGYSLKEVIERIGGDSDKLCEDACEGEEMLGYFEVHIEQGPILEYEDIPVGIVTSIAGQARVEVIFEGMAGHAGTVPMHLRQDSLCAASAFVSSVEDYANQSKGKVVATVGKMTVSPNASNVIPGSVICSLDIRSPEDHLTVKAVEDLKNIAEWICDVKKVALKWDCLQQNSAVPCNEFLTEQLVEANYESGNDNAIQLTSWAGHDAVALSQMMPVCMLFVRCKGGISHHPDEFVKNSDICELFKVSTAFFDRLISNYQKKEVEPVDLQNLIQS